MRLGQPLHDRWSPCVRRHAAHPERAGRCRHPALDRPLARILAETPGLPDDVVVLEGPDRLDRDRARERQEAQQLAQIGTGGNGSAAMSAADSLGPGLRTALEAMTPRSASRCLRTARPMPGCCS